MARKNRESDQALFLPKENNSKIIGPSDDEKSRLALRSNTSRHIGGIDGIQRPSIVRNLAEVGLNLAPIIAGGGILMIEGTQLAMAQEPTPTVEPEQVAFLGDVEVGGHPVVDATAFESYTNTQVISRLASRLGVNLSTDQVQVYRVVFSDEFDTMYLPEVFGVDVNGVGSYMLHFNNVQPGDQNEFVPIDYDPSNQDVLRAGMGIGAEVTLSGTARVRPGASTDGQPLRTLHSGDIVTMLRGPIAQGGYNWYQIAGDQPGEYGYIAQVDGNFASPDWNSLGLASWAIEYEVPSQFPLVETQSFPGTYGFVCTLNSIEWHHELMGSGSLEVFIVGLASYTDSAGRNQDIAVVLGANNQHTNSSYVLSVGIYPGTGTFGENAFRNARNLMSFQPHDNLAILVSGVSSGGPDGRMVVGDAIRSMYSNGIQQFIDSGSIEGLPTVSVNGQNYPLLLTVDAQASR